MYGSILTNDIQVYSTDMPNELKLSYWPDVLVTIVDRRIYVRFVEMMNIDSILIKINEMGLSNQSTKVQLDYIKITFNLVKKSGIYIVMKPYPSLTEALYANPYGYGVYKNKLYYTDFGNVYLTEHILLVNSKRLNELVRKFIYHHKPGIIMSLEGDLLSPLSPNNGMIIPYSLNDIALRRLVGRNFSDFLDRYIILMWCDGYIELIKEFTGFGQAEYIKILEQGVPNYDTVHHYNKVLINYDPYWVKELHHICSYREHVETLILSLLSLLPKELILLILKLFSIFHKDFNRPTSRDSKDFNALKKVDN